ncbi:hypothetical protein [Candidatus Leptofilum sp.]|uniref:hypothetical protein n=1 Tax=Candidatus Leptofilum sp. TaxID=3241576 RepID=UPI003B5BAD56
MTHTTIFVNLIRPDFGAFCPVYEESAKYVDKIRFWAKYAFVAICNIFFMAIGLKRPFQHTEQNKSWHQSKKMEQAATLSTISYDWP